MPQGTIWLTWVALFVGASVPLNRLLPWITGSLQELDSTLDKPRSKAIRTWSPLVSGWIIALSLFKGWLAWTVAVSYGMPDWAQATTLAIVIVGHSWTIFSDDHPTPFWVLIGIFLAMSPPLMFLFLVAFGLTSVLLNLPHLAIVLSVAITAYSAMSSGTLPSIGLPVIIGITLLTVAPKLAEMFDDLPPTLWGLFVKRR